MQRIVMTINLLVDNEFGVLTRITALLRREGFNIKSLAVEVSDNPDLSQMLIAVECLTSAIPKVLARLNKMDCVKKAEQVGNRFELGKQIKNIFKLLAETEKDGN